MSQAPTFIPLHKITSAAQERVAHMRRDYDMLRQSAEEMAHEIMEASQTLHGYAQAHYAKSLQATLAFEDTASAALTLEAAQRLIDIVARHTRRIQGHVEQHERARTNINQLIESAVAMMRPRFDADGQCISIMAMGEPLYAEVDDGLIYQAMINLLSAANYNPQRGSLVEVLLCDGLGDIKILLIDHGTKKGPEAWPSQSEADQLKEDMDLALAEKAILAHGGTMHIQRTETTGRVVTVHLPKIKPEAD